MKVLVMLAVMMLIVSCGSGPTTSDLSTGRQVLTQHPESESGVPYQGGDGLPVDERLYRISGEVIADVGSLTRQTAPASGSTSGYDGYVTGYYVGPTVNGKSFVRLKVNTIEPSDTDWVTVGQVVVVKGTDTTWELDYCRMESPVITP